MGMGMTVLPQ